MALSQVAKKGEVGGVAEGRTQGLGRSSPSARGMWESSGDGESMCAVDVGSGNQSRESLWVICSANVHDVLAKRKPSLTTGKHFRHPTLEFTKPTPPSPAKSRLRICTRRDNSLRVLDQTYRVNWSDTNTSQHQINFYEKTAISCLLLCAVSSWNFQDIKDGDCSHG